MDVNKTYVFNSYQELKDFVATHSKEIFNIGDDVIIKNVVIEEGQVPKDYKFTLVGIDKNDNYLFKVL